MEELSKPYWKHSNMCFKQSESPSRTKMQEQEASDFTWKCYISDDIQDDMQMNCGKMRSTVHASPECTQSSNSVGCSTDDVFPVVDSVEVAELKISGMNQTTQKMEIVSDHKASLRTDIGMHPKVPEPSSTTEPNPNSSEPKHWIFHREEDSEDWQKPLGDNLDVDRKLRRNFDETASKNSEGEKYSEKDFDQWKNPSNVKNEQYRSILNESHPFKTCDVGNPPGHADSEQNVSAFSGFRTHSPWTSGYCQPLSCIEKILSTSYYNPMLTNFENMVYLKNCDAYVKQSEAVLQDKMLWQMQEELNLIWAGHLENGPQDDVKTNGNQMQSTLNMLSLSYAQHSSSALGSFAQEFSPVIDWARVTEELKISGVNQTTQNIRLEILLSKQHDAAKLRRLALLWNIDIDLF